jgi:zinc protease
VLLIPGPPKGFPGFPEYLLADVLIGNSFSSRGYGALRLHDAKSYGVWSRIERRRTASELSVDFAVEQDDFVESIERMLGEIERLRQEPVSTDELETAKIAWRARLSSQMMTSAGAVALLARAFALDGDPAALSSIIESVESVSAADVQQVARREFTRDRMQLVIFANKQKTGTGLLRVGPIFWHTVRDL